MTEHMSDCNDLITQLILPVCGSGLTETGPTICPTCMLDPYWLIICD